MKNKKNNKLKLIICSALAFIVGAFTLASLPQRNYVALAEEVSQEVVHSDIVSENLLTIAKQGVLSGKITSYDYFDLDNKENFPYDEDVILINANNEVVNIKGYSSAKIYLYQFYWFILGNDGLVRTTNYFSLNENSLYQQIGSSLTYPNSAYNNPNVVFPIDTYNHFVDRNLYNNNTDLYNNGANFFEGSIYKFNSAYLDYFQLLDNGYTAEELSSLGSGGPNTMKYLYKSGSSYYTGYYDFANLTVDIYNSITFEVVKLSDLLLYAFNQGVSDGYADGYNSGYDFGYDEGASSNTEYLQYGIFSRCDVGFWLEGYNDDEGYYEQFSVSTGNLNGGALHFNRFNTYLSTQFDEFHIEDGKVLPGLDQGYGYFWENSDVELFFNYQLEYTAPYVYINNVQYLYDVRITYKYADGTTRSFFPVITDGYIEPVNRETGVVETGYLYSISFKFGGFNSSISYKVSPADIVDSIYLIDTSPRLNNISYNEGYNNGFNEGKTQGEELGYNQGFREGKTQGFNEGFDKGSSTGNMFFDFVSAIFDVPVQTFLGLFSFEIWGVNLSNFLLSLLGICLVLSCVKFFVGL